MATPTPRWNNGSPIADKLRNLFRGPNPQFNPKQFSPNEVWNKEVEFQAWTYSTFKNHVYKAASTVLLENATKGNATNGNAPGGNGK
jgi:hypothetical protein